MQVSLSFGNKFYECLCYNDNNLKIRLTSSYLASRNQQFGSLFNGFFEECKSGLVKSD